jgi:hypothetical protein
MKKSNIKENAKMILASNPKMAEVFMTSDGQGFTTKGRAEAHQNQLDAKKEVINVKRDEKPVAPKADESLLDLSVPKLTEALKELSDAEALNQLLADENAKGDDARKGAVNAIEDRLAAIAEPVQD